MTRPKRQITPDSRPMQVYDYLREYQRNHPGAASPSRRELADHFHTSTSAINYCLLELVAAGLIEEPVKHKAREIVLLGLRTFTMWACPIMNCQQMSTVKDECEFHKVQMVLTQFREV